MKLTDLDPMPFGRHKGEPMQDIPASYLHWLWTNGVRDDHSNPVRDYISEHMEALKQKHPDGIWN